ncbi:MAG: hypothetical protein ABEL97_09620 [Salinibacter sp.]
MQIRTRLRPATRGRRAAAALPDVLHGYYDTATMNRRVVREILIALAIFAGIVLAFLALAQFT